MGQKVHPKDFRIGVNTTWVSRWFQSGNDFSKNLEEDIKLREFILKTWRHAGIAEVGIERTARLIRIIIKTSKPGVLIGRGGSGISELQDKIKKAFFRGRKIDLKIDIKEVRNIEESAALLAQNVAEQLEKRMPFRRVMKSTLERAEKSPNVKGVKIEVSGRLGGAEMSRKEFLSYGTIPLHTMRAKIDYAKDTARTTYGAIGVKVWVYTGESLKKGDKE